MILARPALAAAFAAVLCACSAHAQIAASPAADSHSANLPYYTGATADASWSSAGGSAAFPSCHSCASCATACNATCSCEPVAEACGCDKECGCCEEEDPCGCEEEEDPCACEEEEDEVWRLFGDVELIPGNPCTCRDPVTVSIGGWIQGGITGNGDGNRSSQGNYPVPFNQVSDGFIFNQAPWIYAEKLAETDGEGFAFGGRIDYVFGTDAGDTQAFGDQGWDYGWFSSRDYGSAIPQLYADVTYNNMTLRLGHFFTIIGYEVVPAVGNFFYSHALTMNFGEPFTHTGALTTFKPNDEWTFYNGYVFGWDSGFENRSDAQTYLGGFSKALEEFATVTWTVNAGRWGNGDPIVDGAQAGNLGDIYMHSLVISTNVTEELVHVFQHDYGNNFDNPAGDSQWYGINQYLFYTLSDEWKAGLRFEWFDDQDGARIGAHPFADAAAVGAGATAGDYYACTVGMNWAPHPNFRLRPELRWDWFSGTAPDGALPYDNGTEDDLFTAGIDGILQF